MEYFLWSSVAVWVALTAYVLYLRARAVSLGKKLASGGRGEDG